MNASKKIQESISSYTRLPFWVTLWFWSQYFMLMQLMLIVI